MTHQVNKITLHIVETVFQFIKLLFHEWELFPLKIFHIMPSSYLPNSA